MKIFHFLVAAALGQKSSEARKRSALKVNLQKSPILRQILEESIGMYNSHSRHQKREITFDPATLGCKWSSKGVLTCKHAQVSNTVGGRVIYPRKPH